MNEVWKDIKGYEGRYQISNFGNVRSLSRKVKFGNQTRIVKGKILKQKTKKTGYKFIQLRNNMKEYDFHIHRLVALHFVDGYAENMDVNHIDGNKENNNASNLEWCSRKQNIIHSVYILGNRKVGRPIQSIDKNGNTKAYASITEASRQTGICHSSICGCLKRRNNQVTAGGLKWDYL